jgi:DNA-binding MarR family transcriptional regulator
MAMARSASTPPARACAEEVARDCLGSRARLIGRVLSGLYQEQLDPQGLTVAQLNILTALVLARRMTPAALSSRLRLDKSTISRNLRLMIDNGWVLGEGRGRSLMLAPSPEGERLFQAAYPAWRRAQRRTRRLLGPRGMRALQTLAAALEAG